VASKAGAENAGVVMSELIDRLRAAQEAHRGTDLGGLLQWAATHIESQQEAAEQQERDYQALLRDCTHMHERLKRIMALSDVLGGEVFDAMPMKDYVPAFDIAPWKNIMAYYGIDKVEKKKRNGGKKA
jgi:hypothetical protein